MLQEEVQTADGAGGYIRSWKDVAELWAEIEPVSGRERVVAVQRESGVTHRVTLRYRSGVNAGQRLVSDTSRFDIRSVTAIQKDSLLELFVEETLAT